MKLFKVSGLLVLIVLAVFSANAQILQGSVCDAETKEALPFVNINIPGIASGVSTAIDGKFQITLPADKNSLQISYIGYKTKLVEVASGKDLQINLERDNKVLPEVNVLPGHDPALLLMRKVIAHKGEHNPEKYEEYSYEAYNRFAFDVAMKIDIVSSEKLKRRGRKLDSTMQNSHLLVTETVNSCYYKAPGQRKEVVKANRVSGLQKANFTLLATQLQSFSFYSDLAVLNDKSYLNPIQNSALSRYRFRIADTLYRGSDSIFVVPFKPRGILDNDLLKGVLYINSGDYALRNVIAEPADSSGSSHLKIVQRYEKTNGKWFPYELESYLSLSVPDITYSLNYFAKGSTRIDKVVYEVPDSITFSDVELSANYDSLQKDAAWWSKNRPYVLNNRDERTYQYIDSLGKAANLDGIISKLDYLLSGRVNIKYVDFLLTHLLRVNEYEGFRIGGGFETSDKLSKYLHLGGYVGYGFKDKAFKYGYWLRINPDGNSRTELVVKHSQDVVENAGYTKLKERAGLGSEALRNILISRMDSVRETKATFICHPFRYTDIQVGIANAEHIVTFPYRYLQGLLESRKFMFNYIDLNIRYAFGESYTQLPSAYVSTPSKYPVIHIGMERSLIFDRDNYDYFRGFVSIEQRWNNRFGQSHGTINGGIAWGETPLPKLFWMRGSKKGSTGILVDNTFQTVGLNEFLANRWTALFLSHDFPTLITLKRWCRPHISLYHNMGLGVLRGASHQDLDYKIPSKGILESGIALNSIINQNIAGYGVGVFYRYGGSAQENLKNDIVVKISLQIGL